jgi:hypothetical protein
MKKNNIENDSDIIGGIIMPISVVIISLTSIYFFGAGITVLVTAGILLIGYLLSSKN